MKKNTPLLLALLMLVSCQAPGNQAMLDEARATFTYKGLRIHPVLVHKFFGWMSDDAPPVVVTVDVTAASRAKNEFDPATVKVINKITQAMLSGSADEQEWFGYQYIGGLTNGTQVLETFYGGGGSGIFQDVVLVRFSVTDEHLLMTVVAIQPLGDRTPCALSVSDDHIHVILDAFRSEPGQTFDLDATGHKISLKAQKR